MERLTSSQTWRIRRRSAYAANTEGWLGVISTKLEDGGRLVVPVELRRQLGLQVGTDVLLDVVDGALRARTLEQATKDVQAIARPHIPEGVSLVDELIAERRLEALRENEDIA